MRVVSALAALLSFKGIGAEYLCLEVNSKGPGMVYQKGSGETLAKTSELKGANKNYSLSIFSDMGINLISNSGPCYDA